MKSVLKKGIFIKAGSPGCCGCRSKYSVTVYIDNHTLDFIIIKSVFTGNTELGLIFLSYYLWLLYV